MKVVFFAAGGDLALKPLQAVADEHEVVAVIRPRARAGVLRPIAKRAAQLVGFRPRDAVGAWTRNAGIRSYFLSPGDDAAIVEALRPHAPDVGCIASFPWILGPDLLKLPSRGVLNVHPSLLPRHRGPNPLFWTYYCDDRQAGVTVHVARRRADAGPILAQERILLSRGLSITELHPLLAERGAGLLVAVLESLSRNDAKEQVQDAGLATAAPRVQHGKSMVDFDNWPVERVWHFLAGLFPMFREPLVSGGRRVVYDGVIGYVDGDSSAPSGSVTDAPYGWDLHCRGGYVRLRTRGAKL